MSREQVMDWCIEHKVNFYLADIPPPVGWLWEKQDNRVYRLRTYQPIGEGLPYQVVSIFHMLEHTDLIRKASHMYDGLVP